MMRSLSANLGRRARLNWRPRGNESWPASSASCCSSGRSYCGWIWATNGHHLGGSLGEFDVDFSARPIGTGVCGSVFSGLHLETHREVAIKVVHPALSSVGEEEGLSCGIEQEEQAFETVLQAGDSHPNVVDVLSCFEGHCREAAKFGLQVPEEAAEDPIHYFVMERLSAESLADRIESQQGLDEEAAREATRSICKGLSFLHGQGIVHRDVKPANVLFTPEATHSDLKLIDFSHSGLVPANEDLNSQCFDMKLGTAGYVAPEVLMGQPYNAKCDVYSLGCTVHAMLAGGRLPRRHPRLGIMTSLPGSASPEASQFLDAILCPDPKHRPTIPEVLTSTWLQ